MNMLVEEVRLVGHENLSFMVEAQDGGGVPEGRASGSSADGRRVHQSFVCSGVLAVSSVQADQSPGLLHHTSCQERNSRCLENLPVSSRM